MGSRELASERSSKYAVVVDPMSTGRDYPAVFAASGVEVVAVLTEPPERMAKPFAPSWSPELFQHVLVHDGDLPVLAAKLKAFDPVCVIAGSEIGVELADALVEMVLPGTGNVPSLAPARRDKWAMAQAMRAAGVPHIRQFCSANPAEIAAWLDAEGLASAKLVVKPPKSGGTDDVHLVLPGEDWRPWFDRILGKINIDGIRNDAVMVMEFASGPEYLVDSYSVDGEHGLVDVCRYTKVQRGDRIGIYDLVDFAAPDDPDVQEVWAYAQRVLDAVGIRNGCGHTEVIVTADGPVLVEIGARPAGGGHQMITELATGTNQLIRTVEHRVHGRFTPVTPLRQYVCSVVLMSPKPGRWLNPSLFDSVDDLATFHMKHFYYGEGDEVPEATSLDSMVGWVVLTSDDHKTMMADYRRVKALEPRMDIA
ncbi:ATP-grasp domain-containing protein [Labedaea rhizosphaerae]|uniref:ATP-grasp domain-containing protein n=1 Tax=Labedaea rhizosphaerae TaxID=598644 RepID=A0A4R6S5Q9_LABRH|nr:ATP-grasp domain-containing protein [Labedaea rhizosphaerae]TDP94075.1 ATP-grasp domain-containing protein [Labedaea rhizosphaerae]